MRESEIQKEILNYLKSRRIDHWRQNNIAARGRTFRGKRGVHDILGFYRPGLFPISLFFSIEVKRPGKKMTGEQVAFKDMVSKHGHISTQATSVQEVAQFFQLVDSVKWCEWLYAHSVPDIFIEE